MTTPPHLRLLDLSNGFLGVMPWGVHDGQDAREKHGAAVLGHRHAQSLEAGDAQIRIGLDPTRMSWQMR